MGRWHHFLCALVKLDFFFFMKSGSLVVRILILIGRYVWHREACDKLATSLQSSLLLVVQGLILSFLPVLCVCMCIVGIYG